MIESAHDSTSGPRVKRASSRDGGAAFDTAAGAPYGRRMVAPVEVRAVESRADESAFVDLPYHLYRDDARWVPPLRTVERRRWSLRHNASLRGRWVARFVARRQASVRGRIAAIVDPEFGARWRAGAGFFGCFECADDPEAAAALFGAAEAALSSRGVRHVLGPVNVTTQDEVGLLVDGFERPSTLLSPYTPPFYQRLVEAAGYGRSRDYHAYLWTPEARASPAVERVVAMGARRADVLASITVRTGDGSHWDDEVRLLHGLYNACFEGVWGFVPVTWDEFRERAESFKPFYRPELVVIAESGGAPAGFGLVLPDVNAALAGLGGRLLPFGWLRLVRRVPRLRTGRFILLGVLPALTGRGVAALIAGRMMEEGRRIGMREVELSLVLDDNRRMRRVIDAFGCPRIKTWRLYEKAL